MENLNFKIIWVDRLESTNTYLANMLVEKEYAAGTVLAACEQQKGRGVDGNRWESQPGMNLTFSIFLRPAFIHPSGQFLLNKIISLAMCDFAGLHLDPTKCKVKWPNDVYYNLNKLGGVLINNTIHHEKIDKAIVGIGLNINQVNFSDELPNPVSLKKISGVTYDLEQCLNDILVKIKFRYQQAVRHGAKLDNDYLGELLFLGEERRFEYEDSPIAATIVGVDEFGRLMLKKYDGEVLFCDLKQVKFLI